MLLVSLANLLGWPFCWVWTLQVLKDKKLDKLDDIAKLFDSPDSAASAYVVLPWVPGFVCCVALAFRCPSIHFGLARVPSPFLPRQCQA